ncbi:M56 family metallopeptidase [Clostridium fungisolvens]|uniref:Protease HtpX n=1 Tax=Clostridium fungisolvens TaxID=1604897 RepID=A0A6V8SI85_9CLOT|nr:M56 family metallopeptidase [Clostridium fungisolvens]GFP74583.1 Protease HtpX [Clostridium fungisolvens]
MDLLNRIFTSIVFLSLMASAAIVIISIIKFTFKNKFSGAWHYYIWLIVVVRLMLPFSISSNMSLFNYINTEIEGSFNTNISSIIEENNISKVAIPPDNSNSIKPNALSSITNHEEGKLSTNTSFTGSSYFQYISYRYHFAIIWLVGMTFLSIYLLSSFIVFRFSINSKENNIAKDLYPLLERCKEKVGIKHSVKIIYSNDINSPCVLGIFAPEILIPKTLLKELNSADLEYILLHELSHLKRKDLLLNWIMTTLQVIHWFNPIIWLAFSKARKDCEISCDSFVLGRISSSAYKEYGETLIKIAASHSKYKWTPGVTSIVSKGEIKRRIIMITRFKKQSIAWSIIALSLTLLVGCGSLTNPKNNEATNNSSAVTDNTSQGADNNSSNNSNVNVPNTSDNSTTNNNSSNTSNNSTNSNSSPSSQDQAATSNKSIELLKNIYNLAKQGKVPDCEFASKDTLFGDVATKWGDPDKIDYVGSGKTSARYALYNKKGFHFGLNKGDQVFDVRSFKSYLKDIKYNDVEKTLGKPAVINKTSTEHIIIYNVNKTYQLMLIFPKPTDANKNPSLDHISVYDPADAVNNMAG